MVTYRDLYLGGGRWLAKYVAPEKMAQLLGGAEASGVLPAEHIYFLSVDDWDQLVQCSRHHVTIGELLLRAVKEDGYRETATFNLGMHIDRADPVHEYPAYLKEALDRLTGRVTRGLAP